jgi:hypothetical protein
MRPNYAHTHTKVRWRSLYRYTHQHKHALQVAAIREGFVSVVPQLVLPLFTWRQIEMKVCGKPEIHMKELEKCFEFSSEGGTNCVMFWNIVKTFSNDDRAALLGFASGRRRLPAGKGRVSVPKLSI